ncbi:MAG: TolC family protein [Candidatus Gastranaerophilales bacterium]|nr:TolC family protein [Candidatus Gastranaerophilales bacterium]
MRTAPSNFTLEALKEAVDYANSSLFGEYYQSNTEAIDTLMEGGINKEISDDENAQVKGYLQETVIFSLDDCIRKALENNPQIRSAFSNSEIYKTKIGQAWSNYFPTFKATSGYTRNRYLALNFEVQQQEYNYFNALDSSVNQLIFDFGKTKALADIAKTTYQSTMANLDETINTIVYDVKEAYYAVLYALEKENVYLDSVESYEIQLKQAKAFYEIGTKPKIDVTMAEYNLGNAQLGLVKAKNDVKLAIAKLNNAMGLPEENDYKILDKLVMQEYTYNFDELLAKAHESRPALLAYQKKAKASELLVRSSKRAFFPDFEAVGAYSLGGGAKFSDDYGWKFGAQFVYGNTNLMLLKKQMDEAKATHQKDLADLEVEEQNLYLQVKQAYINLKNATESIPITALSLKHAKEQYDLANGRYRVGVGDAIELKDSETTYRTARLDYLAALLQYNISVADLERVVGAKLQEVHTEE